MLGVWGFRREVTALGINSPGEALRALGADITEDDLSPTRFAMECQLLGFHSPDDVLSALRSKRD
jgi:hypothetical protein